MAIEVRHFPVVVPPGSTPSGPLTTSMTFPDRVVAWIEVHVPPGPKGQVGFFIASSRAQVVPYTATPPLFVVADNRVFRWDLTAQPTSGDWQLVAYNTGNFPHTLRVDFGLELTPTSDSRFPLAAIIPSSQLSS